MIACFLLYLIVWNSIPSDVKCAPSLLLSKSHLKTYLLCIAYKDLTFILITAHMCIFFKVLDFYQLFPLMKNGKNENA